MRGASAWRRRRRVWEGPALALLGAAQSVALVATWAWALPLAATAALAWRLNRATPAQAAWLGWCFGTGGLAAAVWWLFISMHRYGGLPAWMAALAVLALSAALSLYLAGTMAVYVRLRRGGPWGDAALFAACWLAAELARGVLFTGFPWGASGYTQVDAPLARLAPWVGVYGIGAALAGAAALLAASAPRPAEPRGWWPAAAVAAALALLHLSPTTEFTREAGALRVRLLQTDVPQDEKFRLEAMPQTLAWTAEALAGGQADLAIGPETVIPLLPDMLERFAPGYWAQLQQRLAEAGRAALLGIPLGDPERGYTNSVVGLGGPGPYRYDKAHLVPFGEFVPPGFRWFTEMMNIPLGDFARGPLRAPSFTVGKQRIGPNICYEDLFGEELARRFDDPTQAPTLLANVSNIAWFGDTVAVPQHLNISRMRTLELQRPMLRATNTGATALVDHRGRVQAQLPPFTRGTLDVVAQGRQGLTPFARWASAWGLAPLAALAALVVVAAWAGVRRQRTGP